MKKYFTSSRSDKDKMAKGQKSETGRRGKSEGKSQQQPKHHPPPPPTVPHHNPQQHRKRQSDDDSLNTQTTEDSIFTDPDHLRHREADKTSSLRYRRKSNHRQQTLSETSFSSSTASSSPTSSSSSSSSISTSSSSSSSSSTYSSSSSSSASNSSLSSSSSRECLVQSSAQKPQHSQSCNDISGKHKYYEEEEEDDTAPLISDEGQTRKRSAGQKNKKRSSSSRSSAQGAPRTSHRGAPADRNNGKVRKAKSMEALMSPAEGERQEAEDDQAQEARRKVARENLMKEKKNFSAFLNEITRQVLSPMRLTTLGVTDAQRPSSPRSPSVRSRKVENCTKQEYRTASADSVCSSKTSYSTTISHSRSFHQHPTYQQEEPQQMPPKPKSCRHHYQYDHPDHHQRHRSCHSPTRYYTQGHHRGRWHSPEGHRVPRDYEDYYYHYDDHHHKRGDYYGPEPHHLHDAGPHHLHRGHGPHHVRAYSERGPRYRPGHYQDGQGAKGHHHVDSGRPKTRQRHHSQGSKDHDHHCVDHQIVHKKQQVNDHHEDRHSKGLRHQKGQKTKQSHKDYQASRHLSGREECYVKDGPPRQSRSTPSQNSSGDHNSPHADHPGPSHKHRHRSPGRQHNPTNKSKHPREDQSHEHHRGQDHQHHHVDDHSSSLHRHKDQQSTVQQHHLEKDKKVGHQHRGDHQRPGQHQHQDHQRPGQHQHQDYHSPGQHHQQDHQRPGQHQDHRIPGQHHHQDHHIPGQHHHQDHHSPGQHHHQDHHSPGQQHHQDHHSPGQHHHQDHHSPGQHQHPDHHSPGQHHHQDHHSPGQHHHQDHHSPGQHHHQDHHSPGQHHHGKKHEPHHQHNSDGRHDGDHHREATNQHRDHHSPSHHHHQSDTNPHQHGDNQTHRHHHGDHLHVDNQHEQHQPNVQGHQAHLPSTERDFVDRNTHSVRRPDSPPPKRQLEFLSSQQETLTLSILEEEQTSFTSATLYEEKTLELEKIMVIPLQHDGLHKSLLKTAVRMECLGEEVMNSQKLLEAELQKTRSELSNLTERFTRLHDNCSSTQQTNTLLEKKLHTVSQNMEGERERLNLRITALTEKLADVKLANSQKTSNATQKSGHFPPDEDEDGVSPALLPLAPPPAQFMDEQSFGKTKPPGQDQCLGSVPEEEESDWSEMGEETPRLILTGFGRDQTWMEDHRQMEMEGIVRCPSARPMQIPQLQFTIHNEIFPPPPPAASCPPSLNNMPLGLACEDEYTFAPNLGSNILIRSASLEELPMALHQMQKELRGTEALMDLHNPGDEGIEISDNEIIHHWRSSGSRDLLMSEGESSLESVEQRFSHFLFGEQAEVKGLSRGEMRGWTGGLPDEVLNGERTEL